MRTPSRALGLSALLAAALVATEARAVPLPPESATAEAEARFEGVDLGPFLKQLPGNPFAEEQALAFEAGEPEPLENSSLATGASFTDLSVHARSRVDKESASGASNDATARAANVSHWVSSGPGGSFDLDVTLDVDGVLDVAGEAFAASAFPSQLVAEVTVEVLLHAPSLPSVVQLFFGTASLTSVPSSVGSPGLGFGTSGDWGDGDFVSSATGIDPSPDPFLVEGERRTLDFSTLVGETLAVGETFAIEIEVETFAGAAGTWEEGFGALSDFFETSTFSLSTDTPGVSLTSVPEPGAGALLGSVALAGLAARLRRGA
jgi:hypothetical protein